MADAKEPKTIAVKVRVIGPFFAGEGTAGHLIPIGSEITLDVATDDDGKPKIGKNLDYVGLASDDPTSSEFLPSGLPNGAIRAGNGQWLVPVGNGMTYEIWVPGVPTTGLDRVSGEEMRAALDDAAQFNPGPDASVVEAAQRENANLVDPDGDGKAGGYVKKADITRDLDELGVTYPTSGEGSDRDSLADLLAKEKAKRA